MRGLCLVLLATGCGQVKNPADPDAAVVGGEGTAIDAPADATGCTPERLLIGGTVVEPQGWSVVMQAPAQVTYGPDFVKLQTTTTAGASTSGQLMLNYPGAIPSTPPFKIEIVMLVEQTNPHNLFDAAVSIMGSYTPPFGAGNDRGQMIYLDGDAVGWADDTQAFTTTITNNTFHAITLAVDASSVATVTVDGIMALTRPNFLTNGAIAIGDQTNDANVDSSIRIRSVTKLCP